LSDGTTLSLSAAQDANLYSPTKLVSTESESDIGVMESGIELKYSRLHSTNPEPQYHPKPSISFILRPERGITGHLHRRLIKSSKNSNPMTKSVSVLIEVPYGSPSSTKFRDADTIIAIAGGIGITGILGYLHHYLKNRTHFTKKSKATRFLLFWVAKEESLITAIRSQLCDLELLKTQGGEIDIVFTGIDEDVGNRPDVRGILRERVLGEGLVGRKVCVVSCVPGGMADTVRAAVVSCVREKGVCVELVEEAFGR
jgi:hypothetical protein